jgi:tetratricopeptide (TPR) repeat protein
MALDLKEGSRYVIAEMKENPYNLSATYLADYEDCLLLLFNGDKSDLAQRRAHFDTRLNLLEKGDRKSPWYRLYKAGIYLHWALINIRFGENFKAATNFRRSYILIKENRQQFPQFHYNEVFLGLEQAVAGTVPDEYKWIASIFGMKGNVKVVISRLNNFIKSTSPNDPLHDEAIIYYNYLSFYLLGEQEDVWKFINNTTSFPLNDNLLRHFVKANIALNYRKADVTISVLKAAERNTNYKQYPIFDYQMGSAYLHKLSPYAIPYFQTFLERFNGNLFIKDAWQKLGQAYYVQGNHAMAENSRKKILVSGSKFVDADKQAHRFAEAAVWPDMRLLKARLLIDGGYYKEALNDLGRSRDTDFKTIPDQLEYNFRLARAHDELGSDAIAIRYYNAVYEDGKTRKEHFAARSALQTAFIYERQGNKPLALKRYRDCLSLKGHDFQNSIDQQAKAGINRLQ